MCFNPFEVAASTESFEALNLCKLNLFDSKTGSWGEIAGVRAVGTSLGAVMEE